METSGDTLKRTGHYLAFVIAKKG